jgi:hypothetical protein
MNRFVSGNSALRRAVSNILGQYLISMLKGSNILDLLARLIQALLVAYSPEILMARPSIRPFLIEILMAVPF